MNRGSYPCKLTADDRLLIKKWKRRVGAVYAAILLVLVLIVVTAPRTTIEIAKSGNEPALSSAAIADRRPAR